MPTDNTINYNQFKWHFGVVEDRDDPLKLGRVRVRYHGVHSAKLDEMPVNKLPWSTLINAPSAGPTSGVGGPITGMVPGTWVVGFFIDEGNYQKPFVLGSIAGIPTENPVMSVDGFKDPNSKFPRRLDDVGRNTLNESDLSRLARGDISEKHRSLINRRKSRITDIPTAQAAATDDSVVDHRDKSDRVSVEWDEPHARAHGGDKVGKAYENKYPWVHVQESESGHIFETDDTPSQKRLNKYHASGTFEEIVNDGTRTTKVVGKDYEVVLEGKNVYIEGGCNVTIKGNSKVLFQGDLTTEVTGNAYYNYRKDKIERIEGNHLQEVMTDKNVYVGGNNAILIGDADNASPDYDGGHNITAIIKSTTETIGGAKTETVTLDETKTNLSKYTNMITDNAIIAVTKGTIDIGATNNSLRLTAKKIMNLKAEDNLNITTLNNHNIAVTSNIVAHANGNIVETANGTYSSTIDGQATMASLNLDINNDVDITGTSTATTDHVSAGKSGATHTHTDTEGLGAGTTSSPD